VVLVSSCTYAPGGYIHTFSISGLGPYTSCPLCNNIAKYSRPEREFAVVGCQSRLQISEHGYLEITATATGIEGPNYVSNIFIMTRKGNDLFLRCFAFIY
jgi:hypothetical protein